ncbi:MAG: HAD family hydrolase [Gemmatimonadales bacterium]
MTPRHEVVFLFDVDNTLLDNDAAQADYHAHLVQQSGPAAAERYWTLFLELREELGYSDYLGALQRYRLERLHDPHLLMVSAYLLDYPFVQRLYPGALDVLAHFGRGAPVVVLSDGDVVFQPRKVQRSGIGRAVDDRVLIYVHKEQEMDEVECRYPADHYVLVDDKLRILAAVKEFWGPRVTTVFVHQGHYAHDPAILAAYPPADLRVERIGDLLHYDTPMLLGAATSVSGARRDTHEPHSTTP